MRFIKVIVAVSMLFAFGVTAPVQAATTSLTLSTDLAVYQPGATVTLTAVTNSTADKLQVTYLQLDSTIETKEVPADADGTTTWTWTAPNKDYQGYLVVVAAKSGSAVLATSTIGVDISSDWAKFRDCTSTAFSSMTGRTVTTNL